MLETFFFIGGIQPKVKVLDETPRRCPRCGLHQAYLKRVDHYVSAFFIPVFKVKTGEPVLICDRCEQLVSEFNADSSPRPSANGTATSCRFCRRDFPSEYTFCPICGRHL
jgi:RNA polymerase subunit RPABC4/transcription elongation factor Spt4